MQHLARDLTLGAHGSARAIAQEIEHLPPIQSVVSRPHRRDARTHFFLLILHVKVSVAVATYNGCRFLETQLESLRTQTRPIDELVVCDDGSQDETVSMARRILYPSSAAGPAVRIEQNVSNLGVVKNFEKAVSLCSGDVIFLCDQDDYWHKEKVEKVLAQFQQEAKLLFLYSNARLVDAELRSLGLTQFEALGISTRELQLVRNHQAFDALMVRNIVTGATVAFRRELLDFALPFSPLWVHDEWLAIVASAVGTVDVLEDCLIDYRQHGGNQIGMHKKSITERLGEMLSARGTFYQDEARRAEALQAHLESLGGRVAADKLTRLADRIKHLRFRAELPSSRLARIAPIAREVIAGRYRRYGRGFRSVVRDLVESTP